MEGIFTNLQADPALLAPEYIGFLRIAAPMLAILLLLRCFLPLLTFRREPEIWAWLNLADGNQIPVTHWETVIGRSKSCDITFGLGTVSRNHAVLTRYDDGSWTISDAGSRGGTFVNNRQVEICALKPTDRINIGGVELQLQPITARQEIRQAQLRTKAASGWDSLTDLMLLTLLQCMMFMGFLFRGEQAELISILQGFGGIMLCQWLLYLFYAVIRRRSFEIETIAFFLCTLGMAAIATVRPAETVKQLIAMILGMLVFLFLGWSLRDLERAKRIRYFAVLAGIGFLVVTLVFGTEYYGAKNWLIIGGMSLQPSELSKVCFVFAGASTMDRIMSKRNLILFIAYSVVICGLLALMNDFGTALIFFCAFLVIAYLRSGSMGTVALAITALGFAGVIALQIAPHALQRFSSWRHIWEDPFAGGYQQTQALMCLASGGLFGLGPEGGLLQHVFAADSDIVFATISEEWGLLMAVMTVLCICVLAFFSIRTAQVSRSSFYTIGGCTAASILVIQTILNCLGTLDILPFTGVTFPFVSNGGTSMIGAWGLLAFVKAADTRQNASFAVRLKKARKGNDLMHRVMKRTWLIHVFLLILLLGMGFFLWEYATEAHQWVASVGSPHLYNNSNIGCGTVVDRNGTILLDISQSRSYAENLTTRKSTLHWLGDRKGYINASAVSNYAGEMAGYDKINGVYAASGQAGRAELTISARVQNTALEALDGRKGTVAVYNYKTGEILCAVTSPTFDPDNVPDIAADTTGAYDGVYLNRFLQSAYVPGSIFKIVTLAAALENIPDIKEQTFQCYGKIEYGTEAVTCETAHGKQTLDRAFANSCNCAFAQIAEQLGKTNMVGAVKKYELTRSLSFDGITTAKGNYNVSDTAPVTFAWSCIGQHSDLVNPARFMTFMGAIAGGGSAAEPYIMAHVENGGQTTYEADTKSTGRLLPKEIADTVKAYMRKNTELVYGDWNFPGLEVCAKSGTSQLGGGQKSNAMFAGFVDSDEYPLAFMVVVENGGYGSHTCVPVLSKVLGVCKAVLDGKLS